MNRHETDIVLRWGDLDLLGHVNNVAYMTFFETARVELVREMGYADGSHGLGSVVVQANVSYKQSATYPGTLKVVTSISRLGNTSMEYHHVLQDSDGDTIYSEAFITCVWIDIQTNKPVAVPASVREWAQRDPD